MNWSRSSRRRAWKRLEASQPPAWVFAHTRAVEGLAFAMARAAQAHDNAVDLDRIVQGAVLHDIGRSITQDIRHASLGATLLRREGWDEGVVLCVERHTGAGITAQEAVRLGLPERDMVPVSLEERIVCHADNLYSGPRRLRLDEVMAKYAAKGLHEAGSRIALLHNALEQELGVGLDGLEPVALPDELAPHPEGSGTVRPTS